MQSLHEDLKEFFRQEDKYINILRRSYIQKISTLNKEIYSLQNDLVDLQKQTVYLRKSLLFYKIGLGLIVGIILIQQF